MSNGFYVKAEKRFWVVIDSSTGLPVYGTDDDQPARFQTADDAAECAEYLNETE